MAKKWPSGVRGGESLSFLSLPIWPHDLRGMGREREREKVAYSIRAHTHTLTHTGGDPKEMCVRVCVRGENPPGGWEGGRKRSGGGCSWIGWRASEPPPPPAPPHITVQDKLTLPPSRVSPAAKWFYTHQHRHNKS